MAENRNRLAALTGLAFFVLALVAFLISGESPELGDPPQEIVDYYVDNETSQFTSAALETLAATALVFFGGYLRRVLRVAEGDGGILSAVAFAGAVILATGLAIDATITFALGDAAGEVDPVAIQTLLALYSNDFLPLALGMQVLMLATGISVIRHGALPKWIGVIAILIGVIAATPIGFASFIGGGILIAVVSVMLALRARANPSAAPTTTDPV